MEITSKSAFISRSLGQASPFARVLEQAGWSVAGYSLVILEALPFNPAALPRADWVLATSRNGVRFFLNAFAGLRQPLPDVRWAAIGPATAAEMQYLGVGPDFTGSGDPEAALQALLPLVQGQRILHPTALRPAGSVSRWLGPYATVIHLPVYRNEPVDEPPFSPAAVLVFTSPMNARSYFSKNTLKPGQRVVAIGQSTAQALADLGVHPDATASAPDEVSLAAAVIALGK